MMTSGQSRDPLFPGGPCALSPTSNNMPRHERLSQLDMIFDVIGTPSRATIDAMTGGHADNRLMREDLLQRNPIKPQLSLAQRFPKATAEAIDLLMQNQTAKVGAVRRQRLKAFGMCRGNGNWRCVEKMQLIRESGRLSVFIGLKMRELAAKYGSKAC